MDFFSENLSSLTLIVGIFLPNVITLVKSATWPVWKKRFIAVVMSAVASLGTYFAQNQGAFDWNVLLADFATIYAMAQVTYAGFWKDTTLDTRLELVGASIGKHAAP